MHSIVYRYSAEITLPVPDNCWEAYRSNENIIRTQQIFCTANIRVQLSYDNNQLTTPINFNIQFHERNYGFFF